MIKRRLLILLALALAACAGAQEENLLTNADIEQLGEGDPTAWTAGSYRTPATWDVGRDGGHSGQGYLIVKANDAAGRSAWRQKVAVPEGTEAVAFGGWYRTLNVPGVDSRGPSLRILFHRSADKWDEIGLKQLFAPPSEDWARADGVFAVPDGTEAVVIEAFHWLSPGETHWDDLYVRPASKDEVMPIPLSANEAVDREPVYGRNLPYHPGDGDTVKLNPPPFRWLPSGDAQYRLQIARDAGFGDGVIAFEGLPWAMKMLERQLEPGTWHWRYGVDRDGEPTVWSKARRFEVPADATPWVYPGREALDVPAERPRLFVTADELPDLRRRAAEGDLKPAAEALKRSVDRVIGEALPPEPPFLPEDRTERGWEYTRIFRETRPPMDAMERAALAYLLTGDAKYGEEAKRRILHFFSWDPHGSTSVFHNDEPAMWVMMRGSRAYDWTYDLFMPAEREKVEAAMHGRASDFYKQLSGMPFENFPFSSHPGRTIGFLGEAALSFLPEWPEAREWADYITQIYWGIYPAWGKDDGGWNEGPGYWSAYMSFGLHFIVALREATGIDLAKRPFFANTPYYKLYVSPPYSRMSPFGDGTQFAPSRPIDLMYWFASLNQDPVIRWYVDSLGADAGSGILSIVLRDDGLESQAPWHLPQARLFEGVGLATLHTRLADGDENVFFAMRSSPYGAVSHGHNDQNTFVLEAYGEPLAIATGYYPKYGSPHHDQWTRQTKAKNGITLDGGVGQDRGWHAQGDITAFVGGEAFDLVVGDATAAYGGRLDRAIREVVHVRPGIYVIRDDLADGEPHRWEYWLHALDEMAVDEAADTVTTTRPKATLRTQFLAPDEVAFAQTDRYDPEPETRLGGEFGNTWHLTASTPEALEATEFLTVLTPAKAGEEAQRPATRRLEGDGAHGAELLFADGRRTVVGFARPGHTGGWSLGGVETDARVAAVTFVPGGRPTAWLLNDGTRLAAGGHTLVAAPRAVTLSVASDESGGRIDGAAGQSQPVAVELHWPAQPTALTRGEQRLAPAWRNGTLALELQPRGDQVLVWAGEPTPDRPRTLAAVFGDETASLRAHAFDRGMVVASGRLDGLPGAWRAELPPRTTVQGVSTDEQGRLWLPPRASLTVAGRGLPERLVFEPAAPAAELRAQPQTELPEGRVYEAEAGWQADGPGSVQVSGGGHQHVSGGDNLWSWNDAGHTLTWTLDVPEPGRYGLWFVGASEVGLLAELRVDDGPALAQWFAPTGGWGRSNADEWRAFQTRTAAGEPLGLDLSAGRHTVALTNRSGLGLNLDRLVLVPLA